MFQNLLRRARTSRVPAATVFVASLVAASSLGAQSFTQESSQRKNNNFIAHAVEASQPSLVHIAAVHHSFFGNVGLAGSGFVLDTEGFIATNAHIVNMGQENLKVTLSSGKEYTATVWAMDKSTDLALVKLEADDAKELVPVTLGKSSELKSGEWVVALGSPLNLMNSVTVGVVSSANRKAKEMGIENGCPSYIQTDCSINMGNSGGPLVNLDGEVVGINTLKAGLGEGISFSIPIDFAIPKLDELKRNKRVSRPFVGMKIVSVTPELHSVWASLPKEQKNGVLVVQVQLNSPASTSGLQSGDIILKIGDKEIKDTSDLFSTLKVDEKVKVEVRRGSKYEVLSLTPEAISPKEFSM